MEQGFLSHSNSVPSSEKKTDFACFVKRSLCESTTPESSFSCIWKLDGMNLFQALIPVSFDTWIRKLGCEMEKL